MKILLADDHKIFREGLKNLFDKFPDMKVIAEANNGADTVKLAEELLPDLIIMDISMPVLNGIEATRSILEKNPKIKIVILSMHSDRRFVKESLKAGAVGYMLKDSAFEELNFAIRSIMQNQTYLSPQITDFLIKDYLKNMEKEESNVFNILTVREREVLQFLAEGVSTKQIASNLNLSAKTVETHRKQIMDKLNIHSIAELTKYAIREGITIL